MIDHAFTFVDTVIFHVGEHNWRSRRAVEKLGAVEARRVVNDAGLVSVHYALTPAQWRGATTR
jgi:RimJ/RimL family protein N-acetyltransferase